MNPPFGATQMGLIYVNPQGPGGNPDPLAAAYAIREAFGRMAMNDEETAALIAGGHTFGKAHGAADPSKYVGVEPEADAIETQGFGWRNSLGDGHGADTITSGLEGAWTVAPAAWTHNFLENLYAFDWVQTRSPAGAIQWVPADGAASDLVPDAHDPSVMHAPIMLTTDLALKEDPAYREITSRWLEHSEEFEDAFARAWFKLTHRDLGPTSRYLGDDVPDEVFVWQDPIPDVDHPLIDTADAAALKAAILDSGLVDSRTGSCRLGLGVHLPRDRHARRRQRSPHSSCTPRTNGPPTIRANWPACWRPSGPSRRSSMPHNRANKRVSLADLIVLGGAAAIERAATEAGYEVEAPFVPGRTDASVQQTDAESFALLEPKADGFRNYYGEGNPRSPAEMLVEKAAFLNLTIPEMTVLVGGMRAMDANAGGSPHGVFTDRPGTLEQRLLRQPDRHDHAMVRIAHGGGLRGS